MNSEEKVNQKSFEKQTSEQYFKQTILQLESNKQNKPMNSVPIFSIMKSPAFVGKIFFLVDGNYIAIGLLEKGESKQTDFIYFSKKVHFK